MRSFFSNSNAWYFLITLLLFSQLTSETHAQVFGEGARTEFFAGFGVRTFYSRINRTQLLFNGDKISEPNAPKVFVNRTPVAIVYGARPKLSLIAVVPAVRRTRESISGGQRVSDSDFGLGDITIFAKYRFYKKDMFLASRQFASQIGIKLPTSDEKTGLGTQSIDYRFALTFTEAHNRMIFSGDVAYALNTEAGGLEAGDVFNYDVAAKLRAFPTRFSDGGSIHQLYVFLELNGIVRQKNRINGRAIDDTGGHQIFLAPGFQFFLLENLILEAGIQIPVLQELNGTQLGTDFHLRTGLRVFLVP